MNGKFLKFDKTGCVTDCLLNDIGSCVDNTNFKCLKNIVSNNKCILCNGGLLC